MAISKVTKVIKVLLLIVTLASIVVAIRTYFTNGMEFAVAYTLAVCSLILICAGILFKSEFMQSAIAIAGISLVCVGVWFFPPWAAVQDQKTAANVTVESKKESAATPTAPESPAKAG